MSRWGRAAIGACALCLLLGGQAAAQGWAAPDPTTDPWNTAKLKIGPFFVSPSFDLRNVGVDNNVFRDEANRRQDLTATIAVATIFGARVKAFSLIVTQDNRYVWFRRYTSERAIDGGLKGIAELRLQNLRPWITVSKMRSTDRAGYEVDARAARSTPNFEAGVDVNFGMRTGLTASFSRQRTEYEEGEAFDGVDLKKTLDNEQTFVHVNGKWQYSEFTDLTAGFEWTRHEFLLDPLRSGDTVAYLVGFQSRGDAPIVGRLEGGYKTQRHDNPAVPDFAGLVLGGTVTTVAFDRVKLDLTADRDVHFSYDNDFPFFVQQGAGVTLTGRVSTRLDLIGSARGEWLRYSETFKSAGLPLASRTDLATVLGIGFLYSVGGIGTGSHFGLTFERAERTSPLPHKTYRNDRVLTNLKFSF